MRLHAPTEIESRNVVGSALRALNRSDEALAQHEHSLRLMPAPGVTPGHRWIVFGNAATCLSNIGRSRTARWLSRLQPTSTMRAWLRGCPHEWR